jgi:RCC1 and BTB domain-containing protein
MNEVTEVYTFGQNNYGELALKDNKERLTPTLVEGCKDMSIISVAAGNELTLVLTDSGEVHLSGFNEPGISSVANSTNTSSHSSVNVLKPVEKLDKHIVKVFANNGCEHIIAISSQGDVFAMGYNSKGQLGIGDTTFRSIPTPIASFKSKFVTTVGLSYYHTVFSCGDDFETYSCGRNDHGQLGSGDTRDII